MSFIYVPANSTCTELKKGLLYYKEKGDYLICGDFNARNADKLDAFTDDTPNTFICLIHIL